MIADRPSISIRLFLRNVAVVVFQGSSEALGDTFLSKYSSAVGMAGMYRSTEARGGPRVSRVVHCKEVEWPGSALASTEGTTWARSQTRILSSAGSSGAAIVLQQSAEALVTHDGAATDEEAIDDRQDE